MLWNLSFCAADRQTKLLRLAWWEMVSKWQCVGTSQNYIKWSVLWFVFILNKQCRSMKHTLNRIPGVMTWLRGKTKRCGRRNMNKGLSVSLHKCPLLVWPSGAYQVSRPWAGGRLGRGAFECAWLHTHPGYSLTRNPTDWLVIWTQC